MAIEVPPLRGLREFRRRTARMRTPLHRSAWSLVGTPAIVLVGVVGTVLRLWRLDHVGFNSDEAVYAGQAASIAGDPSYVGLFPIFRAHPLLLPAVLSLPYRFGVSDLAGRLVVAAFGIGTLLLVLLLGQLLYGRSAGVVAMLFLALMPYHVTVSRQVLLDVPMVFFATASLYCLARFVQDRQDTWLCAAAAALGMAFLTKETAVVLAGGAVLFLVLSRQVRGHPRVWFVAGAVLAVMVAVYPVSLSLSGRSRTGGNYLLWQLFRQPNHSASFYLTTIPSAMGLALVAAALLGLWLPRRRAGLVGLLRPAPLGWREGLLTCWAVVPIVFFELTPVKGFQYLMPVAPVVAVLAARALTEPGLWLRTRSQTRLYRRYLQPAAVGIVALSLVVPAWRVVHPAPTTTFLAGSGGLPAGRETGRWIDANLPQGATLLTLGPSMANVLQFYGHRRSLALSVSPNPLNRNPSYTPVDNPDLELRSGRVQYVVWDAFSAGRAPHFAQKLTAYATKYGGRVVYTRSVRLRSADGAAVDRPVIKVYEVIP